MADARGAGRTRPRGASKIKLHGPTANSKLQAASAASPKNVVLPKLKIATSGNNNYNEQLAQAAPFSPRAHEIPIVLPAAPHPPARPVAPSLRPVPPSQSLTTGISDLDPPTFAKNAWNTPRSPVPETSDPPSGSPSSSALDTFFHSEGSFVKTPARLLSVEETLLSTEQAYPIDWAKLKADADKFLEITATATQHLEGIQADLPLVASTREQARDALVDLSKDIETLHGIHGAEKDELLAQFKGVLTQRNDQQAALERAHADEVKALEESHEAAVGALTADFQRQIHDIEERSAALENGCLQEIEQLRQTMANELQRQRDEAQTQQEQLERRFQDELDELRTQRDQEIAELRSTSETSYHQLLTSSQQEISELKSTSANEIERLLEVSASSLADVTDKLTSELAETKDTASRAMANLKHDHAAQLAQLEHATTEEVTQLKRQHEAEVLRLEGDRARKVNALEQELESARAAHRSQVEQLTAHFTAQLSATTTTLTGENSILVQHHAKETADLRSKHANEMSRLVAAHDAQLTALKQNHAEQLNTMESEATLAREAIVQQYESQLRSVQDDAKREKDRTVLRYESDLDFLRRSTADQIEAISSERDIAIQQLREAHAARVLALETTMRDNDKRQAEVIALLEEELEEKKARIVELDSIEESLRTHISVQSERGQEETCRWSMRVEEMVAAIVRLEQESSAKDDVIESLKRDLRVSEDGNHTKSNTLLELTFVIKSRDEEIEKLHAALLDTIQNVNSKTEILEITAETLSSKAKELEETRAALRMESGRLSRVEEDVQMKTGMLEDSELKIENMRLQSETLRLEMKRLQMDMRLQHEHSAGEMELKQGEIRRLHAAQTELKQKNDIHQETIVRLEGLLAAAQRQGDEMRRRMELLKLESAQSMDDARKLGDDLLENEKQNVVLTKELQTLHNDKVKLQIQLNNSHVLIHTQREQLERGVMLVEDVHCQYQRRLELTAAEKDARLRNEKHLLMLELNSLKDTLRQYEEAESKLCAETASLTRTIENLSEEKEQLEAKVRGREEDLQRIVAEKNVMADELAQQLQQLETQLEERAKRVETLEQTIAETQQELSARDVLIASVSSDATSLSDLLQQKDNAILEVQQRFDDSSKEKIGLEAEVAAVRDQLAHLERVCHEKDEEIAELEKAFNSESQAHLRDLKDAEDQQTELEEKHQQAISELQALIAKEQSEKAAQGQAHQEANFQIQYLVTTLKNVEDALANTSMQLKQAQSEKATQGQAHQEANLQIQYLVGTLKSTEDAGVILRNQLNQVQNEKASQAQAHQEANFQIQYLVTTLKQNEEALAAATLELREAAAKLQQNELEANSKALASIAEAEQAKQLEVEALKQEIESLRSNLSISLQQLEEEKRHELEKLREELTTATQEALATAQHSHSEELSTLRTEHARKVAEADEVFHTQLENLKTQLGSAVEETKDTQKKLEEARTECQDLSQRLSEVREELAKTARALAESEEVIRVRKATVENVRKEMALLMEMQRQPSGRADSESGEGAAPGGSTSGRSLENVLPLIKQQLETFVNEEFHVELPEVDIETEQDLLSHLKDAMRMRYCLSVIGATCVLSEDDVCGSLRTLQQIAKAAVGDSTLSVTALPVIEKTVQDRLRDHISLVDALRGYLDVDETVSIADVLQIYTPVFSLLRELPVCGEISSVHASRASALLAIVADHKAVTASAGALLVSSRTAIQTDVFQSLDDLLPLIEEATFLRQQILDHRDGRSRVNQESPEPATNFLLTKEQQLLLSERHLLLVELANVLEWQGQHQSSPLSRSVHIVDEVRELMRVVHAFESLSSSRRRDEQTDASVPDRAHDIVAFVEELRLITQFAQNMMDEEAEATSAGAADHSHSSSSSSLLSLRGVATRTPTPTRHLQVVDGSTDQSASATSLDQLDIGVDAPSPEDGLGHDLVLSGDALAPTEHSDHLRPSLSGALSESLLDISLVMNDHHRILSEAAHWVGKAHSMSPRNKRKMQTHSGGNASIDFASELSLLVRDHCSLLSLSRKLFRLQDPRQDLPSVLQCLAVLSRLTDRLGFFDLSIRASDSSESLRSDTDNEGNGAGTTAREHEKLKASLSVFASMEEIARHLQDYDAFVGRMVQGSLLREAAGGTFTNIESLGAVIEERLKLVDQLGTSLGLTSVVDELPAFVEAIQRLAAESIAKRGDDEGEGGLLPIDTILMGVSKAFNDSDSLHTLLERMRETLPFASSAESPEELMERLNETISQCDELIQAKEQAWKMVENLTEQLAVVDKQHAEEDDVLSKLDGENIDGLARVDRLSALSERLKALQQHNEAMKVSIAAEKEILCSEWPQSDANDVATELDDRVTIVRALIEAKQTLIQDKKELEIKLSETTAEFEAKVKELESTFEAKQQGTESAFETKLRDAESAIAAKQSETESMYEAKLRDALSEYETSLRETQSTCEARLHEAETTFESQLSNVRSELENKLNDTESALESKLREAESQLAVERQQLEDTIREEKIFLGDRGVDWSENESRIDVFDRLLKQSSKLNRREQQLRDEVTQEASFLRDNGMILATREEEIHASRMAILKTLFEGQRVLIDEKMEREIVDQQELARLEADGITIPDREAIITRLIDLTKLVKQLVSESAAHSKHDEEVCAQEVAFLQANGITDIKLTPSESRIPVYQCLLERVEAAKQTLVAWEGSPHGDALGCREADDLRAMDREKLEQQYVEATAVAVAAALEKQAQQLDFRRAALAVGDSASLSLPVPPPSKTAEEFIEAFTKRDNAAISMIYRLIRLTTDVLNTSAFTTSAGSGGEIPVDLSQAVMLCVKELKALKEYLLQTLEQITRDNRAFVLAQPPLAITRESVTNGETAIDFALLLQRDFVVHVHKTLEEKCTIVTSTIQKLSESLAAHAGDFSDAEAKYMAMEMQLSQATAEKATLEAKYVTQDEFMQRFVDERKRVEAALMKALEDAKKERADLQLKMEMLEAEKCEAVALAHVNGIIASPSSNVSTPRTPMSSNGRVYSAVVPTRPDKPRELMSSRLKTGMPSTTGAVHKERFVSDLERETGQRRAANAPTGMTARRANEWKRHELLTSSTQIEQQFRAMNESSNFLSLSSPESPSGPPKDRTPGDQELWYQGVRMLQHVSFFVSVFFVPKQKTFRVEVFNSDSEQQQTIYVTLDEMQGFVGESKRALKNGITLDDPARYSEVVDVLFERVKVLGSDPSNLLFAFQ